MRVFACQRPRKHGKISTACLRQKRPNAAPAAMRVGVSATASNRKFYQSIATKPWHKHRDISASSKDLIPLLGPLLKQGDSWLDIGCGRGDLLRVAQDLGVEYQGIDLVLPQGVAQESQAGIVVGDFLQLEFSGTFALVSFFSSLHHFEDWRAAVERALRLLRPGGVLLVDQEPNPLWAVLYGAWLKWSSREYPELLQVEIHWLQKAPIAPDDLPSGETMFHRDYFPGLGHVRVRSRNRG